MALTLLDLGTSPNKGDGTKGRDGGQIINDNFTELYGLINGTTSFEGLFKSSAAGSGIAFDFDSENAISSGRLFNFSSAGTDILSLLDDGTESTLKFQRSATFGNTNLETSSALGEFTFKEAVGGTMTIDPLNGKFTTSSSTLTFSTSGGDAFDVSVTQFRPSSAGSVNMGAGGFEWNNLSMSGQIIFGAVADTQIVNVDHVANTGLKIGTATSEQLAFYNSTPIAQPSSSGENTGYSAVGGTNVNHQDTFTGNVGTKAYTINDIVKHLKNLGLIASS